VITTRPLSLCNPLSAGLSLQSIKTLPTDLLAHLLTHNLPSICYQI
jgi:hypothetical protein